MITEHEIDNADNLGEPAEQAARPPSRRRRVPRKAIILFGLLAIFAGGLLSYRRDDSARSGGPARPVSAAELETQYGVRVDLVALTGLGGLIQLRFTVLDKTKAETLFRVAENMPALIVESSDKVLHAPSGMRHHLTLLDGASYFVLYANAGNSVAPGTKVSVQIDTVKLEHLATAS